VRTFLCAFTVLHRMSNAYFTIKRHRCCPCRPGWHYCCCCCSHPCALLGAQLLTKTDSGRRTTDTDISAHYTAKGSEEGKMDRMTAECPAKLTIRGGIFTYTSLMGPHTHKHTHTLGHTILSPLKNLTFFYDFHVSWPPLLLPLDTIDFYLGINWFRLSV